MISGMRAARAVEQMPVRVLAEFFFDVLAIELFFWTDFMSTRSVPRGSSERVATLLLTRARDHETPVATALGTDLITELVSLHLISESSESMGDSPWSASEHKLGP